MPPRETHEPNSRLLLPLSATFIAALLIANTISIKVMVIGVLTLPAGIIVYPLVSVMGDVITEVYGYRQTRRVVWCGFLALLMQNIAYYLARFATPAEFWAHQDAFDTVLSMTPRIALASLASYPVGEFVNAAVLAKLKLTQRGKGMGLRFVGSTMIGQAADSLIFITIAFAGTMPTDALFTILLTSWAVKVIWEVVALPISISASRVAKRIDRSDVFDDNTVFNPLKF